MSQNILIFSSYPGVDLVLAAARGENYAESEPDVRGVPQDSQLWLRQVSSIDQSETSIQVTWQVLTNQRSVFRSRDKYGPIRDQYSGHVTSIDQ